MKYEIYEKNEIVSEIWKPNTEDFKFGKMSRYEKGEIDLNDLSRSKFNILLSEIPNANMEELKTNGETIFTIITKQTIVIRNEKEN
jgi:hypothetical protein